jgi:hypothetical protein
VVGLMVYDEAGCARAGGGGQRRHLMLRNAL